MSKGVDRAFDGCEDELYDARRRDRVKKLYMRGNSAEVGYGSPRESMTHFADKSWCAEPNLHFRAYRLTRRRSNGKRWNLIEIAL